MNKVFDVIFWPLRMVDPIYGLTIISLLTGLAMVLVYRYTSDQKAIRRVKDRIQAHVLEVRLFQEQLGIVARAYARILRWTLTYMRYSLTPLAVMLFPVAFLLVQLDLHLGRVPLKPQKSFLLKARFSEPSAVEEVSLRLPEGLSLSAPALHIPAEKEVDWRIRAEKYGDFEPEVVVAGRAFTKQVTVSDRVRRLSPERARAGFLERFLHPAERPLPSDGPLEALVVNYNHSSMEFGPFRTHWLIPFIVLSLLSAFILKSALGIEL